MYSGSHTVITLQGHMHALRTLFGHGVDSFSEMPVIGYFGIGIGGMTKQSGLPRNPSEKNVRLFEPVPVKMIEKVNEFLEEDLTEYRHRTEVKIPTLKSDGVTYEDVIYYAYWLKKIEIIDIKLLKFDREGIEKETVVLDMSSTPTIKDPVTDLVIDDVDSYPSNNNDIMATISIRLKLNGAELQNTVWAYIPYIISKRISELPEESEEDELGDALNIPLSNISEIGIYSGLDEVVTDINGTRNELVEGSSRLMIHRCMHGEDMTHSADNLLHIIDIEQSGNMLATYTN